MNVGTAMVFPSIVFPSITLPCLVLSCLVLIVLLIHITKPIFKFAINFLSPSSSPLFSLSLYLCLAIAMVLPCVTSGTVGVSTLTPSRYIRFIFNRVILENAVVRAAAVSTLGQLAPPPSTLSFPIYFMLSFIPSYHSLICLFLALSWPFAIFRALQFSVCAIPLYSSSLPSLSPPYSFTPPLFFLSLSHSGTFATRVPDLRPSIIELLQKSLADEDDEVQFERRLRSVSSSIHCNSAYLSYYFSLINLSIYPLWLSCVSSHSFPLPLRPPLLLSPPPVLLLPSTSGSRPCCDPLEGIRNTHGWSRS